MKTSVVEKARRWAQAQWPYALAATLLWCAMLPLAGSGRAAPLPAAATQDEWPREWRGQALQPLARSAVEARFAERFPGRIARFRLAAAGDELVLREVQRPTRMLHPAADCWRGIGWRVQAAQLRRDDEQILWRCFEATHAGQRVRVCERIVDAQGRAFTDTSAWFWAASLGQSAGPWQAITHVQGLGS
ncbi:MAG: hypothetical protein Q8L49_04440 [Burkholderiaceae bacterium]|nr:hypothetical protein [Burkholderiaceae bacterium]